MSSTVGRTANGVFGDDSFGFYKYSPASVRYSALQEDIAPPPNGVPKPTSLALVGLGLFAAASIARKRRKT